MSRQQPTTATADNTTTAARRLDPESFRDHIEGVRRLVVEEWPDVDPDSLAKAGTEPEAVVAVVVEATGDSKTLVRHHLAQIAEVSGVAASGLEGRLLRLLHTLEGKVEPVQETMKEASKVAREVGEQGREIAGQAEAKVKENIWTSLMSALGLGVLIGLVVGLSRGR